MSVGSRVRRILPRRVEPAVARAYRSFFINLDSLASEIASIGTSGSLLDVGCGSGELSHKIFEATDANVHAIDLSHGWDEGYLDQLGLTFEVASVADVAHRGLKFDSVLISDVLHHIPVTERVLFLRTAVSLIKPGGSLIVKDWAPSGSLIHGLVWTSDRLISGDKNVKFVKPMDVVEMVSSIAPEAQLSLEKSVKPWRSNYLQVFEIKSRSEHRLGDEAL